MSCKEDRREHRVVVFRAAQEMLPNNSYWERPNLSQENSIHAPARWRAGASL